MSPPSFAPLVFLLAAASALGCPQLLSDDFDQSASGGDNSGGLGGLQLTGGGGSSAGHSQAGGASLAGAGGNSSGGSQGTPGGAAGAIGGSSSGSSGAQTGADAGPPSQAPSLSEALIHRYEFNQAGSVIVDTVGGADGSAEGGSSVQTGSGRIELSGSGQLVNLPNRLISPLTSTTIEAWVDWRTDPNDAAADWQAVFSFGMSSSGEGEQGPGTSYLILLAKSGATGDVSTSYTSTGYAYEVEAGPRANEPEAPLPAAADPTVGTHVAVVANGETNELLLFVEGVEVGRPDPGDQEELTVSLSSIDDRNNWIGRNLFSATPEFEGGILELRIYDRALSPQELALSFSLGPDASL